MDIIPAKRYAMGAAESLGYSLVFIGSAGLTQAYRGAQGSYLAGKIARVEALGKNGKYDPNLVSEIANGPDTPSEVAAAARKLEGEVIADLKLRGNVEKLIEDPAVDPLEIDPREIEQIDTPDAMASPGTGDAVLKQMREETLKIAEETPPLPEPTVNPLTSLPPGIKLRTIVVDKETGLPKRVYHGTDKVYLDPKNEYIRKTNLYGPGHYFTEDREVADEYATAERYNSAHLTEAQNALLNKRGQLIMEQANAERYDGAGGSVEWAELDRELKAIEAEIEIAIPRQPNTRANYLQIMNPVDMDSFELNPVLLALYEQAFGTPRFDKQGQYTHFEKATPDASFTNDTLYRYLTTPERPRDHGYEGEPAHTQEEITQILMATGYDGITHTGGSIMGDRAHKVWIAFDESQLVNGFDVQDRVLQKLRIPESPVQKGNWSRKPKAPPGW